MCVEKCWTQQHLLTCSWHSSWVAGGLSNEQAADLCSVLPAFLLSIVSACPSSYTVPSQRFAVAPASGSCAHPAMAPLPPNTIMVCVQVAPQTVGSATATARAPRRVSAMGVASSQAVVAVILTTLQLRLQLLGHLQMMQQRQKFQGRHVAGAAWFRPALRGLLRATLQILVSATMRRHVPPLSCICKNGLHFFGCAITKSVGR